MRSALELSPLPDPAGGASGAPAWQALVTVAFVAGGIIALYFGQDILIPLALAALLSFALAPLVSRLRRLGLPRVPAVLGVVFLAFAAIGGFGLLVGSQLSQLTDNLPVYQQNIRAKIRALQAATPSGGLIDQATEMLHELGQELQQAQQTERSTSSARAGGQVTIERAADEPITVRVQEPDPTPFEVIESVALPLLAPVGTAGIVVVFVIFMLLEREDLRDRLIRLVGGGDLHRTTEALNEAAGRVSRFLLMQLVVNATYGIPIGVGLWLIGIPNALLWGVLATVLRFVPYVGPFIAALFPIALAVAVDPGWSLVLWTVALFLALELVSNNVVEPWLYGASTGISTVAILVAAIFWTTLWGPVGLLLSTPITVCLAVLGRYVPHLSFLDVLLGSDPVLTPPERFYQRMLVGDLEEGEEIAEEFLARHSLAAFYDEVALPALRLAESDRHRKLLVGERRALVTDSVVGVVADLADHEDDQGHQEAPLPIAWTGKPVLCIAGRTGLDRAAAAMLAQLLERRGIGARVLSPDAIGPEGVAALDLDGVELVCLSYLGASAVAHARQACRRLRRRAGSIPVMVGLWNGQLDQAKDEEPTVGLGADLVATSLTQAVEQIAELAAEPATVSPTAAPIPADEPQRLASLRQLGPLDTPADPRLDRLTQRVAAAFEVPICLISLVDADRQFWKAATGLPQPLAKARGAPRDESVCGHVVGSNEAIVVEDVRKDARFAASPLLREHGLRFYAGAPLRRAGGHAIGTLCILDTKPRRFSTRERALLQLLAEEAVSELERYGRPVAPDPTGPFATPDVPGT